MFLKGSFNSNEAREKVQSLLGNFKFTGVVNEVNDILEEIRYKLQIVGNAPDYVLTRAIYEDDNGKVISAKFTVRPASKYALEIADCKKSFTINACEDFFDKFIEEMANWFDEYLVLVKYNANIGELNTVVVEVIEANEIPYDVKFTLGEGIIDASDNHVVIGLSTEVVEDLASLPLFDKSLEVRVESYKAAIAELLKQCDRPYEIVKQKTLVTKNLGIYSRRAVNKLIRVFVNRNIDHVRTGVGYVETDEYFAVVEKTAVTENDLETIDTTNVLIIDNANASSVEKKAGETKIVVGFRIAPFNKETLEPVTVELANIVK